MQQVPTTNPDSGFIDISASGNVSQTDLNYDKSLIAIASSWPGLVADLSFEYGGLNLVADTLPSASMVIANGNWVQVAGHTELGKFSIYMPSHACGALLRASDNELNISKLGGRDAALVLEHIFSQKLYQLEEILGTELVIEKIADVSVDAKEDLLGLELEIDGEKYVCALGVHGKLQEVFESVIGQHSIPAEKHLDGRMIVHLGPVVVPARQAYLARIGEAIDCGVNPSDVIQGVLMRADGRYWPIYIEDEEIEIAGDLSGPVIIPKEKSDQVFVTFGLGEVSLNAYTRSKLEIGSRVSVERIPDNGANVYYQTRPFGQGSLSILGSNLAVNLNRIGAFSI